MHFALAPLQTYTDYHFRNALQAVFGGVDRWYAPYLKMNNDGTIKSAPMLDILPKNNTTITLVPQAMASNAADFLTMARYAEGLGYTEINLNIGCPYPMVTNKKLGAAMLCQQEDLIVMVEAILKESPLKLGIKMRMGMEDTSDILQLLPRLNDYPLTEIMVHARYAKQLYTGTCDHDRFAECISLTKHQLWYNGDITDAESFNHVQTLFPSIDHFMIGRGALANPALFSELKDNSRMSARIFYDKLNEFNGHITESLLACNPDTGYALSKLKSYWEYLCEGIDDGNKLYRKLKKSKTYLEFTDFVAEYLEEVEY